MRGASVQGASLRLSNDALNRLHGTIGVVLASGFHANNMQALRLTIFAVVIPAVFLIGRTTLWMLEVLRIWTRIRDE
jgi:hypothetical protein